VIGTTNGNDRERRTTSAESEEWKSDESERSWEERVKRVNSEKSTRFLVPVIFSTTTLLRIVAMCG